MARTVWKFTFAPNGRLAMPAGAETLTVAAQGEDICLWAEVRPNRELEIRRFLIVGTGHEMPETRLRYVGTVHLANGLVFHVYEMLEPDA